MESYDEGLSGGDISSLVPVWMGALLYSSCTAQVTTVSLVALGPRNLQQGQSTSNRASEKGPHANARISQYCAFCVCSGTIKTHTDKGGRGGGVQKRQAVSKP